MKKLVVQVNWPVFFTLTDEMLDDYLKLSREDQKEFLLDYAAELLQSSTIQGEILCADIHDEEYLDA
jgi:hypothetical protein